MSGPDRFAKLMTRLCTASNIGRTRREDRRRTEEHAGVEERREVAVQHLQALVGEVERTVARL